MSRLGEQIVVRFCHNQTEFMNLLKAGPAALPSGVDLAPLPCSGKVEPHQILSFFAAGADGALIQACPPGACRFVEGNLRAAKRASYAAERLSELGLSPARVRFRFAEAGSTLDPMEIINDFKENVRALGPTGLTGGRGGGGNER
jgi:coenzyme F420-reducing hydrogenase delta subunit